MALTPPIGYESWVAMNTAGGNINWIPPENVDQMVAQGWSLAGGGGIDPSDPGVFYGEGSLDIGGGSAPVSAGAVTPTALAVGGVAVGAALIILRFSAIAARFGVGVARQLFQVVRQIIPGGGKTMATRGTAFWTRIPPWLRTTLNTLGVVAGYDILFDDDSDGGAAVVPSGGVPGTGMAMTPGVTVIGTWVANGITFYRLSNGYLAVQNSKGRWKTWKPKRPIVLMPSGAGDLRTLLRADRVVNTQIKKLDKIIRRRKKK